MENTKIYRRQAIRAVTIQKDVYLSLKRICAEKDVPITKVVLEMITTWIEKEKKRQLNKLSNESIT